MRLTVGKTPKRTVVVASLALLFGFWGAFIAWRANVIVAGSDLDEGLAAARFLMHGLNPYTHVGPGLASPWPWPIYYPLPAFVLEIPFALLSDNVAHLVFVGLSSALLAAAVARKGEWHMLLLFASTAFVNAAVRTQWAPILMAAFLWPALGFVYAAKPNVAAALWGVRPSRSALVGSLVVVAVSFALQPTWLIDWLRASPMAPHLKPAVLYPWGWLVLFAAFRWREPNAKMLLFLALIPQTLAEYAALPLFLVTGNRREAMVLLLGTALVTLWVHGFHPSKTDMGYIASSGQAMVLACYLPCSAMLLFRRSPDRRLLRYVPVDVRGSGNPTP